MNSTTMIILAAAAFWLFSKRETKSQYGYGQFFGRVPAKEANCPPGFCRQPVAQGGSACFKEGYLGNLPPERPGQATGGINWAP